jgi:tripartite-type tricarboxylate transporter receptor subunit TctC
LLNLLVRVIEGNKAYARPGAGRRKPSSRPSSSNKHEEPPWNFHAVNFCEWQRAVAALPAVSHMARAQAYPSRPIMMIVPFPPGGAGADTVARILAEHMMGSLGQPVIIENVSGAGGSIGVGRAVRAPPDGYTLSIGNWASHVGAGAVYPVQYDVLKDFEPVSRHADAPLWIVAKKTFPAADLKELIVDGSPRSAAGSLTADTHR